jgi:20S proteasome alpha/beta subunit
LPEPPARRYNRAAVNYRKKRQAMTYCCGILVREGLVMIADTRTNAGLDNVSTFRKLNVYTEPG